MSVTAISLEELRSVDLFDDLDDDQLAEWLPVAQALEARPGHVLAEAGQVPPGVILLLEGHLQALLVEGDRTEPAGRQNAPTWIAAIAVLTGGPLGVRMQAETDCRAAVIDAEDFQRLAFAQPAVHRRVMQQVAPVMSRITATEQNRERLASLGTMAAGLAHELNNPAAAARSAATQMAEALDVIGSTIDRFVHSGVEREQAEKLLELHRQALDAAEGREELEGLEASDAEDELIGCLEEIGVSEPWRVVAPLAAAGVEREWLSRVSEAAGPATGAAVAWLAATLTARSLAEELRVSTDRMVDLVGAVKTYAYMDRGELVEVDVHEGIKMTFKVLAHRLKHTEIRVEKNLDPDLPKLTVRGSELNQVWTNLLDNAIDALGDSGTITIATRRAGDFAEIEIADDGPGIAPRDQERVFDSFFTTKDVGHGTGLGLATAWRIVVDRHFGTLTLDSKPGRTAFVVRLPLVQN